MSDPAVFCIILGIVITCDANNADFDTFADKTFADFDTSN